LNQAFAVDAANNQRGLDEIHGGYSLKFILIADSMDDDQLKSWLSLGSNTPLQIFCNFPSSTGSGL
jgi:hypothetical protein